jgi:hypothetical protein
MKVILVRFLEFSRLDIDGVNRVNLEKVSVSLEDRINLIGKKLVNLFWSTADEEDRINHGIKLIVNGLEQRVIGNTFHQIVGLALTLDDLASIHRVDADRLMQFLPVATGLDT